MKLSRLETSLAGLLHYGSWLASAAIALGLALALINAPAMRLATAGLALLILLPIFRVTLMLFAFLQIGRAHV